MFLMMLLTALAGPAEDHATGFALQREGRTEEALTHYQRCLDADPDYADCHWEIGWSHWKLSDWAKVVHHWEQVERIDPGRKEVAQWLPTARENVRGSARLAEVLKEAPKEVRPPVPEGRTLRLRAVGDIMLGSDFPTPDLAPHDGAELLAPVASLLRDADLTFGNLEGPLCDGGTTTKCKGGGNCYAFRSPTRYAAYLKSAGFDLMSTANNHSGDFGETCRRATEAALDAQGIAWSGPPGTIATVTHDGWKVGMVAFHTSSACNYVNDHDTAARLVEAAAATHDLVIVSFHGGAEGSRALRVPQGPETFLGENRGDLRAFSRAVIGAGAHVVFGHGPHVPRGMEVIDGHLVAYSLGNFATWGKFNLSGHLGTSLVLDVTLDSRGQLIEGRILPVKQHGRGEPKPDPEGTAIGLIRELSIKDFAENAPVIAADGRFVAPTR